MYLYDYIAFFSHTITFVLYQNQHQIKQTELAGVLNSLGTEVHLVVRKGKALREFDPMISDGLDAEMTKAGIIIHRHTNGLAKVVKDASGKKNVTTHSGDTIYGADVVLMAAGRVPNTEDLCANCEWAPNTEELCLDCCGVKVRTWCFNKISCIPNQSQSNPLVTTIQFR